jgi:hypothetical protein
VETGRVAGVDPIEVGLAGTLSAVAAVGEHAARRMLR